MIDRYMVTAVMDDGTESSNTVAGMDEARRLLASASGCDGVARVVVCDMSKETVLEWPTSDADA